MARFTLPRDLYHGKGSLEELKNLGGKKAFVVVGGGSMKRFGFLDRAINALKEGGMEVYLFENVEPDPSVETVMRGAAAMTEFQPDWIVAMGGGSPIDAAKAMWAFYEYPNVTFEELCIPFNFPKLRQKAHFCAIPSTSGTATEVTAFSVITDYAKGIKYPLADFNITPDVAIVDPELAEKMPPKLTAHTGMDAMTHAIEAYVSTCNCDYTDPLALHAIKIIHNDLVASYNGDMDARRRMHNAQCLAGMRLLQRSAWHRSQHGPQDRCCLLRRPHRTRLRQRHVPAQGHQVQQQVESAAERYADIARFIKLEGNTTEELVEALIAEIKKMNAALNIPTCIKEYEGGIIDEKEFMDKPAPGGCRTGHWRCLHRFQPPSAQPGRDGEAAEGLLLRPAHRFLIDFPALNALGVFTPGAFIYYNVIGLCIFRSQAGFCIDPQMPVSFCE